MNRSLVWHYFHIKCEDNSKAVCNLCHAEISRGGSTAKTYSTTSLRNHLKAIHRNIYLDLEESESKRVVSSIPSPTSQKQQTLSSFLEKKQPYPDDHPQAQRLSQAIGRMICLDIQPYSVVEDSGFRGLLNVADPR